MGVGAAMAFEAAYVVVALKFEQDNPRFRLASRTVF